MRVILKNRRGSFEIGGGAHKVCRLVQYDGLGIVPKSTKEITFPGQGGVIYSDICDDVRTITLSIDFNGCPDDAERLYKIINEEVEICIYTQYMSRKISGQILSGVDVENIIHNHLHKAVLQFSCACPYFNDIEPVKVPILHKINHLPNLYEDGRWLLSLPAVATTGNMTGTIRNSGSTILYPVIRITNGGGTQTAASGITLTNHANGAVITLDYTIEAGDVIQLDLPKRKITSSINGDITSNISDDTILSRFCLEIGENIISAEPADSSVSMYAECEYYNNYVSAVI